MKGIRQHDIKDCGAACLATILRYYKSYIPMVKIREKMCVDKNGASMFSLCKTANHFGLIADGYQADLREVVNECEQHNISLPIIMHIVNEEDMFHYVVLNRVTDTYVYVFDPAKGNRKISINDCIASTGFYVCRPLDMLHSEYCYYLMISDYVVCGLNQFMKGDNSPSISKGDIDNWLFPLPPFSEQQRIVGKIEKLFSVLDSIQCALEA